MTLGGATNAVTVSSNVTLGGATSLTNVPALGTSQFVKTDGSKNLISGTIQGSDLGGAAILNQNGLQAGATAYPAYVYAGSSASIQGPMAVSGQITAGTGANVITTAAGLLDATKLTNTVPSASITGTYSNNLTLSGALTLGGATNAVTVSSNVTLGAAGTLTNVPALSASQFVKTDASKNLVSASLLTTDIPGGATSYIQNTAALQSGATAYPSYIYVGSSATVQGSGGLAVTYGAILGSATVNNLTNNQYVKTNGSNQLVSATIPAADMSALLSSTNTWTAAQTFTSSVTVSTNLIVNNGGVITGNGSGITNLTGSNIVSGIPSAVLPSTVAYLSVNQLWTAPQTQPLLST